MPRLLSEVTQHLCSRSDNKSSCSKRQNSVSEFLKTFWENTYGKREGSTACTTVKYDFYSGQFQMSNIMTKNQGNH